MGVYLNIVPFPLPYIFIITEQIMNKIGLVRLNSKFMNRYFYPSGMCMERVKIDYHKYYI